MIKNMSSSVQSYYTMESMTIIKEGQLTLSIYRLIRDKEYDEAAIFLQFCVFSLLLSFYYIDLNFYAWSLFILFVVSVTSKLSKISSCFICLGFCYYHTQEFTFTAKTYGKLVKVCSKEGYKIHHCQSLINLLQR